MGDAKWKDVNIDYADKHNSIEVARFEIETESLFNMKELYKRIYDWLIFEDYRNVQTDAADYYETLYWEKQHPVLKEHQIWWRAYKVPVKDDANRYFFYYLKINWQTIRAKPAEVMFKGKKWSTNDANIILRITAYLIINDKTWTDNSQLFGGFLKAIQPRFRKWLYKEKIWYHRKFLYDKAFELQNVIKEYLGERTSQELPPNIYKEKGLG